MMHSHAIGKRDNSTRSSGDLVAPYCPLACSCRNVEPRCGTMRLPVGPIPCSEVGTDVCSRFRPDKCAHRLRQRGARLPPAVGIVSRSCRILLTNTAVDMWLSSAAPSSWRPPALKTCATTLWGPALAQGCNAHRDGVADLIGRTSAETLHGYRTSRFYVRGLC